jgi:hypothetical protein
MTNEISRLVLQCYMAIAITLLSLDETAIHPLPATTS